MTVRIRGNTRIKSQTLVGFPPQPALNLNFTQGYANGLNPLPSTVTFTRNDAGAYATQVGPDGLVRLAAHNMLTYSQDLTNAAWTKIAVTATISGTAPDGTQTANMYMETAVTQFHYGYNAATVVANQIYTYSAYLKNNGSRYVALYSNFILGSSDVNCIFDLATGLFNNLNNTSCTASMVYVGNGWYRCNITGSALTSSSRNFGVTLTNSFTAVNSYLGVATNGAYVWGAQVEQNLTPSYYVPTTTAAKYADTPRFDYSPVTTEPLGLLIEEARTNLATYSEDFTGSAWQRVNLTCSGADVDAAISPDGRQTADFLRETATASVIHQVCLGGLGQSLDMTSQMYSASIFIKTGGRTKIDFSCYYNVPPFDAFGAVFDLSTKTYSAVITGAAVLVSASIVDAGNGWLRCSVSGRTGKSGAHQFSGVYNNGSGTTYTGDTSKGMYFWGAQLEAGSFATSYIPTVASAVTRAAESATMTGTNFSSWYSATNGTFKIQSSTISNSGVITTVSDGTANNRLILYGTGSNTLNFRVVTAGATEAEIASSVNPYTTASISALTYQANNCALSVNGGSVVTDTSVTLPTVDRINFGSNQAGASIANATIARVQYWPARFSDAKLQLITKG